MQGDLSRLAETEVERRLFQTPAVAPIAKAFPIGPKAAAMPLGELLAWAPRIDAGERVPLAG